MNLFTLAFRNLQRRAARSSVVSISVGLAVASALNLVTLADSIGRNTGEGADERGANMLVLSRNASDLFSSFIPEDTKQKLAAIAGVGAVSAELVMYAPIESERQSLVTGWAADSFLWNQMPMKAGRTARPDEHRVAVLGAGPAETLHKKIGDRLNIFDADFTIVGVTNYLSALNRSMIYMPLRDLQEIAFREKQVTLFELKLAANLPAGGLEEIKNKVARLGPLLAVPNDQLLQHDRNILVLRAVSRSVSLIALTMGALSVLNTLLMAVQERTREIGVMMAIGWSRSRTMAAIVFEGILIGVAGCLAAIPFSFFISIIFERLPTIGGLLSFRPTLSILLPTLLVSILICGVGSLYPAWRAASLNPADAFRRL